MIVLLHTLAGLALGGAAGSLIRLHWNWPDAPAILAASGCAGQVCRAVAAYLGRPSEGTYAYQLRVTLPGVAASAAVGLASALTLLHFPATFIAPAASYLVVRAVLAWRSRATGSIDRLGLRTAARSGELLTLLAAIIRN